MVEMRSGSDRILVQISFQQLLLLVGLFVSLLLAPTGLIRLVIVRPVAFELEITNKTARISVNRLRRVGAGWETSNLGSHLGWLKGSVTPGKVGNCVVVGHYALSNGQAGPLAKLDEVAKGDEIVLYPRRKVFTYRVESVEPLKSLTGVSLGNNDRTMLTLVAKVPGANYLVVKALLIEK